VDSRPGPSRPRALAYAVFDADLTCAHADETYARMLGVEDPDSLVGRSFRDVNPGLSASESRRVTLLLGNGASRARQVHLHLRPAEDGGVVLWQFGYTRAKVSGAPGLAVGGLDVTAQASDLLERSGDADSGPLGGLSDMAGFRMALTDAIRQHREGGSRPGVLLVDVAPAVDAAWPDDRRTRDLVLVAVSRRLRNSLREGDLVTRLDGYRFSVLCAEAGEVFPVADRVRESLTRLLVLGAGFDVPGPRMGTAAAIPGEPADRLLGRACAVVEAAVASGVASGTSMAMSRAEAVVDLRDRGVDRQATDRQTSAPPASNRPAHGRRSSNRRLSPASVDDPAEPVAVLGSVIPRGV